jgi:hypothetical protein
MILCYREVLDNANELRVMLCKDKVMQTSNGMKKGTTVIAACGKTKIMQLQDTFM